MTKISEDLTSIEEALEELLLEFRDSTVPQDLSHAYRSAGQAVANKITGGLTKLSHKLRAGEYQDNIKKHSAALNQAHADYETHTATGDKAGIALAKNNIAHHTKEINNNANNLRAGGNVVDATPTLAQKRQQAQQEQEAAQKKADKEKAKQERAQAKAKKQTNNDNVVPFKKDGNWYKKAIKDAKARGDNATASRLMDEYNSLGTVPIAASWEQAERAILNLMEMLSEGMENTENHAVKSKHMVVDGNKIKIKRTFAKSAILKGKKGDPKVELRCKIASLCAESPHAAFKRKQSNATRDRLNLDDVNLNR